MTAVIFDCDGTLVDSEPLARRAWEQILGPLGYAATSADFASLIGLPYPQVHAYFARRAALPAPEAVEADLGVRLRAIMDAELRPFDDAVDAVRELHARGIPLAVASSSARRRLDFALTRSGVAALFAVTVAGDEIERGKPAPDMFLAAAARLGAEPAACVVVEDSPAGVQAGVAAGMTVVGVLRDGPRAALAGAHEVVERLSADDLLAAPARRAATPPAPRRS